MFSETDENICNGLTGLELFRPMIVARRDDASPAQAPSKATLRISYATEPGGFCADCFMAACCNGA